MREVSDASSLGLVAIASLTTLILVVAGVGVVGLWAGYVNSWRSLFLMERVIALATPVAAALVVVGVVSVAAVIARV